MGDIGDITRLTLTLTHAKAGLPSLLCRAYISPISPLYLPISPLYLPISPLHLPQAGLPSLLCRAAAAAAPTLTANKLGIAAW